MECMKIRSGYIPSDIIYTFGISKKVARRWELASQPDNELEFHSVTPALVADVDNAQKIKNNKRDAESACFIFDPVTQSAVRTANVQQVEAENLPMSGLRVVTVESTDGTMGYKVMTPNGYLVDVCNDVLLEAMTKVGIEPGGTLAGEYLWGIVESTIKLVRIDSELFEALLDAGDRHVMSTIPKNSLVPGMIYETKTGERGLFLGWVNSTAWALLWKDKKGEYTRAYPGDKDTPKLFAKPLRRSMLWFDVGQLIERDTIAPIKTLFAKALNEAKLDVRFKLKPAHKMIKEVEAITIPEDVVEQVRQKAIWLYNQRLAEEARTAITVRANLARDRSFGFQGVQERSPYQSWIIVARAAACCLMHTPDSQAPTVDEHFARLGAFVGKEFKL